MFWLVQGAVAFAGDSSAKAKGTLTETSIPIESWQLAELTWGEPGENSALLFYLILQMFLLPSLQLCRVHLVLRPLLVVPLVPWL